MTQPSPGRTTLARQRPLRARVSPEEYQMLLRLRERRPAQHPPTELLTLGEKVADMVAASMGSWRFIILQSMILMLWVVLNLTALIQHWDPYPFILLNLMLSFQAAYAAPIIMMSQNRQATIDRRDAMHDYQVNMKAELEIELLHDKMNLLRESELAEVLTLLRTQKDEIEHLRKILEQSSLQED